MCCNSTNYDRNYCERGTVCGQFAKAPTEAQRSAQRGVSIPRAASAKFAPLALRKFCAVCELHIMIKGSFKIWEAVIAGIGIVAGLVAALVCFTIGAEDPKQFIFGCIMFAALALFVRPIWLLINWKHMYDKEHSAMVTNVYYENYGGKGGKLKITKLTYGKKKKRKDITVANVMFFSPKLGKTYKLVFSSRKPEEFLILPTAWINAAVFAALGIDAEITLISIMLNLKG